MRIPELLTGLVLLPLAVARAVSEAAPGMLKVVLIMTLVPAFAAEPPASTGPEGLLMWEEPRDIASVSFDDSKGEAFEWADFSGKVLVVNLWATWCGPCREEMPTLDELQAELGGSGFEVVALSLDRQGEGAVSEFYQQTGVEHLDIYIDETGMAANELKAVGVPTTLLLNTEGKEIGRLTGTAEWDSEEMVAFLADLIP